MSRGRLANTRRAEWWWKDYPVDAKLSEQIKAALETLTRAYPQATGVTETMKQQGIDFGLGLSHLDDDLLHLISRLRYLQLLAERMEQAGASLLLRR